MTCACKSFDRYECWSLRYPSCRNIELDGGPCECVCHDADDEFSFQCTEAVMVSFNRKLSDDELRFFHEVCERSAPLMEA